MSFALIAHSHIINIIGYPMIKVNPWSLPCGKLRGGRLKFFLNPYSKTHAIIYQMRLFSRRTFVEILNQTLINLSSGWLGVAFIAPGIFGVKSVQEYILLLFQNVPFGIVGLVFASIVAERIKK